MPLRWILKKSCPRCESANLLFGPLRARAWPRRGAWLCHDKPRRGGACARGRVRGAGAGGGPLALGRAARWPAADLCRCPAQRGAAPAGFFWRRACWRAGGGGSRRTVARCTNIFFQSGVSNSHRRRCGRGARVAFGRRLMQKYGERVPVAQWIERLVAVQEVAGSTPAGDATCAEYVSSVQSPVTSRKLLCPASRPLLSCWLFA